VSGRRSFLAYGVGMLASVSAAFGQRAILENGQAVVCKDDSLICPLCKKPTCPKINAPLMIGNDNREYPDSSQLFDFHIIRCDNCRGLFTRE
jgi:hypothetical protein